MNAVLASIRRYPVKSMLGEELDAVDIAMDGVTGDRRYALTDADRNVATAKNPRKWKSLLACRATTGPDRRVLVELPSGEVLDATNAKKLAAAMSDFLGKGVDVSEKPAKGAVIETVWADVDGTDYEGHTFKSDSGETITALRLGNSEGPLTTFVDWSPLHLLTTGSLRALSQLHEGTFDVRRYRPNLVVETHETGFVENGWIGRTLTVGNEVRLQVTTATPRCVMTTLEQEELPRDSSLLKAALANRMPFGILGSYPSVGVYADVLRPGRIRRGDTVRLVQDSPEQGQQAGSAVS